MFFTATAKNCYGTELVIRKYFQARFLAQNFYSFVNECHKIWHWFSFSSKNGHEICKHKWQQQKYRKKIIIEKFAGERIPNLWVRLIKNVTSFVRFYLMMKEIYVSRILTFLCVIEMNEISVKYLTWKDKEVQCVSESTCGEFDETGRIPRLVPMTSGRRLEGFPSSDLLLLL